MGEWMSTDDYWYVRHAPCGEIVRAVSGIPMKEHRCSMAYGNGKCFQCGATVKQEDRTQHDNFHTNFIHRAEVKNGEAVSAVKWCDAGNHAFKANAPGSQSLDVVQRDDDGAEQRVTMDMCADHAFNTGTRPTEKYREVEQAYEQQALMPTAHDNPPLAPYVPYERSDRFND